MGRYDLTEADIKELTKPSPWRDYMMSGDPRTFEEYMKWWNKQYETKQEN